MRKNMTIWEFDLGTRVKDRVTGYEGTITARIEYLNGCLQYCVEAKLDKEGKIQKHQYVDEGQLKFIAGPALKLSGKKDEGPGGRMPNEPE